MKTKKLTYSIKVPLELVEVIQAARKHLAHSGYKSGGIIFISDVFTWGLKLIAKELGIDLSNGLKLEFVEADTLPFNETSPEEKLTRKMETNSEFRAEEYRLALILSKDPKYPLVEYDRDYKPKGISLQEFIKIKKLDL